MEAESSERGDVPAATRTGMEPPAAQAASVRPLWEVERQAIESAIEHFSGNVLRAAAALEISPSTIYRKRQAWEQRGDPAGTTAHA